MARFLSPCLLASTALLLLVQLERVAALSNGVGCVDSMGADGPSVGVFHGKGRELSQCVRDYRQKYCRDFECGRGLRGKICVQIKDHLQSFLDDLSLCLAGPTTVAPTTTVGPTTSLPNPRDCKDLFDRGETGSSVSTIFPDGDNPVSVRCIDSCTVMINRDSFSAGFDKSFADYAAGFGNRNGDYYLGNEALHTMTSTQNYTLRVDIVRPDGTPQSAEYTTFRVGPASDFYRLTVGGYSGNAGDALDVSNGQPFVTFDSGSMVYTDLAAIIGGGFWYSINPSSPDASVTASSGEFFSGEFFWGDTTPLPIAAARLCLDRT